MSVPKILHSLYGRAFGWGPNGELIVNRAGNGKGVNAQVLVEGVQETIITTAQLLALNATPQPIITAPGAGKAIIPRLICLTKPAGTGGLVSERTVKGDWRLAREIWNNRR